MQAQPSDEGQATESARAHGKVDDDHVGLLRPVEAEAIGEALRLDDLFDARVLKKLTAALQHDRMIVDDENAGHDISPTSADALCFCELARCTGIST